MIQPIDKAKCRLLLRQNYIGRLSYIFNNKPYVVPITYYFDDSTNAIIGYSGKGHKIKALRLNSDASLEVSIIHTVSNWQSVLVQGTYKEFQGSTAKIYLRKFADGVKEVIHQTEGKDLDYISEFSSKVYKEGPPIVFKITIEELTGRQRKF